jgi:hypothetical protein
MKYAVRVVAAAGLYVALGNAGAQQVWKCEVGGQVRYSDRPCPDSGQALGPRSLQPNLADGIRPEVARAAIAAPSAPVVPVPQAAAGNACPGDSEIRDMQTRAGSTSLGDAEQQFIQDEVRRAWQCRKGQGRYTEADWAVSRQAQAAQSNLGGRDRDAARRRAEAMHSAADPDEGDRIARRRLEEERALRRQPLRRPGQNPPLVPNS